MAIDPTIALQYRPPQLQSPIDQYQQAMALKSLQGQQQLQQGQIQTNQLENQQRQMSLQSQQALQQNFAQSGGDLDKFRQAASQDPRVLPGDQFKILETMNTYKKSMIDLDKAGFDLQTQHNGLIGSTMQNIAAMPDEPSRAAAWPGAVQQLTQSGIKLPPQFQQQYPGIDAINQELNLTVAHGQLLDQANKQRESQSTAAKNTAEAGLATAQTPGATAKSTQEQFITQMMQKAQAAQQSGQVHPIDAILGQVDPKAAAAYKPAYDAAMAGGGPDAAKSILQAAAEHAGRISMATSPEVQASEVDRAKQIAAATAPIEVGKAIRIEQATAPIKTSEAIATAKALRNGDNAAVSGVAPAAVTAVQNSAIKLDQDYAAAKSATETLGRVLDLAGRGNAAAGANVASLGAAGIAAVNGIKRLNPSLVESYGNAGSLLQDIQGKLSHWEGTGPLPAGVLDQIRDLHQSIGQQAYQTYTDSLTSLNTRSGAKFQPTLAAPNISKGGAIPPEVQTVLNSAKPGIHKLSDGTTWMKAADGTITKQ